VASSWGSSWGTSWGTSWDRASVPVVVEQVTGGTRREFPPVLFGRAPGAVIEVLIFVMPGRASGAANKQGARLTHSVSLKSGGAIGEYGVQPFVLTMSAKVYPGMATGEQNLSDEELLILAEAA